MIERIIAASARNLTLVVIGTAFMVAAGVYAVLHTPLDALPDLSDTQVIVYTELQIFLDRLKLASHLLQYDLLLRSEADDGSLCDLTRSKTYQHQTLLSRGSGNSISLELPTFSHSCL
jgi:hypothetical protein